MQVLINASFGIVLGVGLYVIGLPNAPLWGFVGGVMRFIPYVGTWVGLAFPVVFSLAAATDPESAKPAWVQPVEVVGLFMMLELITANLLEPLLFGMSAGVSPLALLVAAIFWAWLWGPIGLILSTPMTVVLLVMGRYVPQLHFFEVLLGDEPALEASVNYYQRLLARDQDEANDVVEEQMQSHLLEQVFDVTLLPALLLAKRDRERGELQEEDEQFILQGTRDLVNNLGVFESLVAKPVPQPGTAPAAPAGDSRPKVHVVACPAVDEIDELALLMFRHLLQPAGVDVELVSVKMLSSEVIAAVEKEDPTAVLIGTLPPGGMAQTRYLCKRLRSRFPDMTILVGRWGVKENVDQVRARLTSAGATQVGTTLGESRGQLVPTVQALAHVKAGPPATQAVAVPAGK
jgi:hypothetical protein